MHLCMVYEPCQQDGKVKEDVLISKSRSPTKKNDEEGWTCSTFSKWHKLRRVQDCTCERAVLNALSNAIKKFCYQKCKSTFHSEKSLICKMTPSLKGDRVIIPFQTRGELDKKRLQFSHRGMHTGPGTGSLLLALFNLYKEIEEYISKCQVCNIYQQEEQKEPMILRPYASPFRSW